MRMRLSLSGVAFLAVLAAWMPAACADAAGAGRPGSRAARAMQLERALGPGVDVRLHRETGRVRFVGTPPGRPIPGELGPGAPAATARAFLDSHRRDFGLERGSGELRVTAVVPDGGGAAVRMRQAIDSVPVLAGELVVGVDAAGDVLSVLGEVEPGGVDTTAEIAPAEARRTAILAVAKYRGAPADVQRATEPSLAVYDSRLLGGPGLGAPALVWRVEVSSPADPALRELVLVDAHLGVVAATIDLTQEAKDRRVCDAGNEDSDYPCVGPYDREEGEELPTENPDVDAAYDFAGDTYDFFSGRFGRDSLDGAGLPLISTVRYCPPGDPCPFENAFWDGGQMVYGEGYAAADDVVGHELSHGFTQYTSNLFYWYQSGAINESMSDVFGEYVDLTNGAGDDAASVRWLLGEDVPGGAIRDMRNPPAMSDPDRMTSSNFVADVDQDDEGGVHTNSGVGNKAAYLIADGDTFNGRTVTGIGIGKAARVYHDAEVGLLTSGSDYADLYEALQQACTNSIDGSEGITVADCEEVKDAVDATEMNLQPAVAPAARGADLRRGRRARSISSSTTSRTRAAATGRTPRCPAPTTGTTRRTRTPTGSTRPMRRAGRRTSGGTTARGPRTTRSPRPPTWRSRPVRSTCASTTPTRSRTPKATKSDTTEASSSTAPTAAPPGSTRAPSSPTTATTAPSTTNSKTRSAARPRSPRRAMATSPLGST